MSKEKEEKCKCEKDCKCSCDCNNKKYGVGHSCIYGMGFIGAVIFFIGRADTFKEGIVAFLKAIVWPVFMVLELFKFLIK